jgi:MoaA/NifB/PqqE/SkfB family radical SAM enzyme
VNPKYYENRIKQNPGDKEAYLKLLETYTSTGRKDKAEKQVRILLDMTPDEPFHQDLILNKIELAQRKTVLESRVKRLWVTVTTRCNIRCRTCGLWKNKWDLPYETAKQVMELYPFLDRLVWLGGEVFMYEHFEEMFDKAAQFPILRQQVITNGVILNEKWIKKIVFAPNTELTFSVDGTTKEVYESIKCGASFDKLLENIRLTMEMKEKYKSPIDIRLNVLIMRSNYHQLEDFIDFAKKEGFNQMTYLSVHFNEAEDENIFYEKKDPEISEYIGEAIPRLREKAKKYNLDLDILLPPGETEISPERKAETGKINCDMPWMYMMICDYGDVLLTGSCVKSIGNIYKNSLDEIWNSPQAQLYRKSMIEHKHEGICRSECMSRWQG